MLRVIACTNIDGALTLDGDMRFYIHRDKDGKVLELSKEQNESQEIVEFLGEKQPSEEEIKNTMTSFDKMRAEYRAVEEAKKELEEWILKHFQLWANFENVLSILLQDIVSCPGSPSVARAIYFSLGGFEARFTMVTKALQQFVLDNIAANSKENAALNKLVDVWGQTNAFIQAARKVRNIIAHGHVLAVPHGGMLQARVSSSFTDPINFGNLLAKGSLPGLGTDDVRRAALTLHRVGVVVGYTDEAIKAFYMHGPKALPEIFFLLDRYHQELQSQKPVPQSGASPQHQPGAFPA